MCGVGSMMGASIQCAKKPSVLLVEEKSCVSGEQFRGCVCQQRFELWKRRENSPKRKQEREKKKKGRGVGWEISRMASRRSRRKGG